MIAIGKYNVLKPIRNTSVGVFLEDGEGTELLLPNKYVPRGLDFEGTIEVFCYLDHQERPIATTLAPKIKRDEFALLEVVDTTDYGAFLDWGLEKHLFVPFREQTEPMKVGSKYLVYCFLDEKSFRLVASTRLNRFLEKEKYDFEVNERVGLLAWRETSLGWEMIINQQAKGLLFFDDIHTAISLGDEFTGYIKKIRTDGKIDVTLQALGAKMLEPTAELLLTYLEENHGFISLTDKSEPEVIKQELGISKKAFKKAVGVLYKSRKVVLEANGIRLIEAD